MLTFEVLVHGVDIQGAVCTRSQRYKGTGQLTRLIDAQLIEPAGWGRVDFALPYLREYLREHAAIEHVRSRRSKRTRT